MNKKAIIQLTRVDNRLVHGQVGVTWVNSINADTIVVVDDDVVLNPMRQKLMEGVAHTSNVRIRFYSVDDFANVYHKVESSQRLFLVVENPVTLMRLVKKGIFFDRVNFGNMHYQRGKVAFSRKMYVSEEEIDAINYLLEQGVYLYYQDVPGTMQEKIGKLDYESMKKRR